MYHIDQSPRLALGKRGGEGSYLDPAFLAAWKDHVQDEESVYPLGRLSILKLDRETGRPQVVDTTWGLLPNRPWVTRRSDGRCCYNARADTVKQRATFKSAIVKKRCLVPAAAFYEWSDRDLELDGHKHLYQVSRSQGRPFMLAGIYEAHPQFGPSSAVLTVEAGGEAPSRDRPPLALEPELFKMWLDPQLQEWEVIRQMLYPAAGEKLVVKKLK